MRSAAPIGCHPGRDEGSPPCRPSTVDPLRLLDGHDGEIRPTHRAEPKRQRDWRTRNDLFEGVWLRVLVWLQEEPDRTGTELLARLQEEHAGEFSERHLRTLQRRLKPRRRAAARKPVFTADAIDSCSVASIMS